MRLIQIQLLLSVATAIAFQAIPWKVKCPQQCVCQIRPWYTPRSLYSEAPTVDCNDLFISKVPENLPEETQTLLLQSNNIAKIYQTELDYLVNLTELDLSQNSFSSIKDFGFRNLPQLLSLHLEENQFAELSDNCFSGLSNLQELYLNHNQLNTISPQAFSGLDNLLRLHLNSNRLRMIESRWFEVLRSLEILMIGGNPVISIQDQNFRPLTNLRSLVLAGMNLNEISDYALEGLSNLESLSFYDNKLIKVPRGALQKVPGLKFLDLNKNPIQRIQERDFLNMLHLKELGINNMDELVSVDKYALHNLPELTKLEVTNNPKLSFVHPHAFHRVPQMETLMLNNNALSALHKQTVESLPNLQEISIHSNPIRCDCILRWVNTTENHIRFIEPQSTFCIDPPELKMRRVKDVPFREMTDRCLPLISVKSFSSDMNVKVGKSISLHCRALAEPEPEIYWVTPSGSRLIPFLESEKFRVHPEGTLDIYNMTVKEAGLYSCVAHNLIGVDTRSVAIKVNGYLPTSEESTTIYLKEVNIYNIVVSWKPSLNTISSNLTWFSLEDGDEFGAPHMARVPAGTNKYNITRLQQAREYMVCLHVAYINLQIKTSCISIRTKEAISRDSNGEAPQNGLTTTAFWVLLVAVSLIGLYSVISVKQGHGSQKKLPLQSRQWSLSSMHTIYPPFIKHWDLDQNGEKVLTIDVQATPLRSCKAKC
ncbi:leucine-rich repeat neuronal protein 2 [Latimeria chalumnae]|uniref:leucine-rich repeat neuronal protein 2 n=1 Tax=Latimeria chalumnae TaxID=7897 RepID=UPI0003C18BA3|nr:PREDICTED: leucine-rich repeat neuronal protein 2 [Latimeria chalumnae]|eukprot:XP_005989301.1 PREDICTED: leucine-rich repeat neuronal protein 2 [Latimeria chalumnae]